MKQTKQGVEADLYVLHSLEDEKYWASLKIDHSIPKPRNFKAREDVVSRSIQPVPVEMPYWVHERITIDDRIVAERAEPIHMPTSSIDLLPDTTLWHPMRIVSGRLKSFFESEFPDGGKFFPFRYFDVDTGQVANADFWYWLPLNFIWFQPPTDWPHAHRTKPLNWSALGQPPTTWEFQHNEAAQKYVQGFPYWTCAPTFGEIVFTRDLYQKLKCEGFTGFIESEPYSYTEKKDSKTIGYVIYDDNF